MLRYVHNLNPRLSVDREIGGNHLHIVNGNLVSQLILYLLHLLFQWYLVDGAKDWHHLEQVDLIIHHQQRVICWVRGGWYIIHSILQGHLLQAVTLIIKPDDIWI